MSINPGTRCPATCSRRSQIANDLGEQVVNLVPAHGGTAPALASGANVPAAPNQVPADVGQRGRLGHPAAAGHPGRRPEQADRRAGHVAAGPGRATCAPSFSAGTTFSKEFVAYQQQFTELLANAPPALDAVTAVAPQLRQDLANTAALRPGAGPAEDRAAHAASRSGSSAFGAGGPPRHVAVRQPRLHPARHGRHPVQPRPADQPDQPVAGTGLQPVLLRRRRQDRGPRIGQRHHERRGQQPESDSSCAPGCCSHRSLDEQAQSYASPNQIPDTLPGAGCVTVVGNGVGPATQAGFTPAAGGHVVAPTAQEADVELNGAAPPSSSAAYVTPASNLWALLAVGVFLGPALLLAWGARPARRRARRR